MARFENRIGVSNAAGSLKETKQMKVLLIEKSRKHQV